MSATLVASVLTSSSSCGGGWPSHPSPTTSATPTHCHTTTLPSQIPATQTKYANEPFVHVLPAGIVPQTHHVRGTNYNHIQVFKDRQSGRAIVISGEGEVVASGEVRMFLWHGTFSLHLLKSFGHLLPAVEVRDLANPSSRACVWC